MATERFEFENRNGVLLAAALEKPAGAIAATALFAHCFTCSKDILAARTIARTLAEHGMAVLRFDFTGLGLSQGEFANTNFSSNIADLLSAAHALAQRLAPPSLLIGHSLGGAAVLAAAHDLPAVRAVATIGAPADPAHVLHNLGPAISAIEQSGKAQVTLAGRPFTVQKQFLDDVRAQNLDRDIARLKRALLVMHAPTDQTVGIENAAHIFKQAKHPKSFVALAGADHLLSDAADARYAGRVIAVWASIYVSEVD